VRISAPPIGAPEAPPRRSRLSNRYREVRTLEREDEPAHAELDPFIRIERKLAQTKTVQDRTSDGLDKMGAKTKGTRKK
jgi:hypothetical protein